MYNLKKLKVAAGVVVFAATASLGFSGTASAGLSTCEGAVSGGLPALSLEGQPYTTCMVDSNYTQSTSGELAAVTNVFGTGWVLIGKEGEDWATGGDDTAGLSGTFGVTGTISMLTSLFSAGDEIAIIMKTGGGQSDPSDAVFGLWSADALNPLFIAPGEEFNGTYDLTAWGSATTSNALSHFTIFRRPGEPPCIPDQDPECTPDEAPEPGPIGLLGLGMVGLYVARRKLKKQD